MQNTKDFLLELGQLSKNHVTQLSDSFNNLPGSEYLDGQCRLRRYSLRIVTKDIQSYEQFLRKRLLKLPHILEAQSHVGITEVKHTTELPINAS
jgi:hypothetical protein